MKDVTIDVSCYREGRIFGTNCNIWMMISFLSFPLFKPTSPLMHTFLHDIRTPTWFHQTRWEEKKKKNPKKYRDQWLARALLLLLLLPCLCLLSIRHGVCSYIFLSFLLPF